MREARVLVLTARKTHRSVGDGLLSQPRTADGSLARAVGRIVACNKDNFANGRMGRQHVERPFHHETAVQLAPLLGNGASSAVSATGCNNDGNCLVHARLFKLGRGRTLQAIAAGAKYTCIEIVHLRKF